MTKKKGHNRVQSAMEVSMDPVTDHHYGLTYQKHDVSPSELRPVLLDNPPKDVNVTQQQYSYIKHNTKHQPKDSL